MGGCGCVPARLWLQRQDRLGLAWGQSLAIPDVDSGELWSVWEQRSSLLGEDGFGSRGWQSWARGWEAWSSLGSPELWAPEDTAVFLR